MSDEQKTGEVDPATGAVVTPEADGSGAAVEPVPEESPEKVEELREELKFTKQRHQQLVEDLNQRFGPDYYAQWKDQQHRGEPSPGPAAEPATPEPAADADEFVTVGALQQMKRDIINSQTERDDKMRNEQRLAGLQAQYNSEYAAADAAIIAVIEDLKLPEDVVKQVHQQMGGYGINVNAPTGPSGYARAFIDLAKGYKPAPTTPPGVSQAEIEAADKARQLGLTQLPSGTPVGVQTPSTGKQVADQIAPDDPPYRT